MTGGTYEVDPTWSAAYTAWKDGQPKADATKREKQDCVKVVGGKWDEVDCTNTMPGFACSKTLA